MIFLAYLAVNNLLVPLPKFQAIAQTCYSLMFLDLILILARSFVSLIAFFFFYFLSIARLLNMFQIFAVTQCLLKIQLTRTLSVSMKYLLPFTKVSAELSALYERLSPNSCNFMSEELPQTITILSKDKHWYTAEWKPSLGNKQTAYQLWSSIRSSLSWENYCHARSTAEQVYRVAEQNYDNHLKELLTNTSQTLNWWTPLKSALFGRDSETTCQQNRWGNCLSSVWESCSLLQFRLQLGWGGCLASYLLFSTFPDIFCIQILGALQAAAST